MRRVAELVFPVVSRALFLAKLRKTKIERYSVTSRKTWILNRTAVIKSIGHNLDKVQLQLVEIFKQYFIPNLYYMPIHLRIKFNILTH